MAVVVTVLMMAGLALLVAAFFVAGLALAGGCLRSHFGTRLVYFLLVMGAILMPLLGLLGHGGSAHEGSSEGECKNNFLHNELIVTFFLFYKLTAKIEIFFYYGKKTTKFGVLFNKTGGISHQ